MTEFPDRPVVRPAQPWSLPVPQRSRLDNGLSVLTYDLPGQHVLSVRVALPAPLTREPVGLEGVGTIMARTLDEGSTRHTADEMAELLERRGVALGASVGDRGVVVEMEMPKRNLSAAVDLLREAMLEPVFPDSEIQRHVRTRRAEIDQERATAPNRAAIEFVRTFYREGSRYAVPTGGDSAMVGAIVRDDVAGYHAAMMHPDGATLVVAGDLTGVDVPSLAQEWLSSWAGSGLSGAASAVEPGRAAEDRADDAVGIVLVDRPDSVQSELYVGCPGPSRNVSGGWAPYPVLGFLVGGSPTARIDAVLREDLGYTYGMRCLFRPRVAGGLFVVNGSVRSEVTAPALGELIGILGRAREGFTAEETSSGVDYMRKTAPGRYATADVLANEAAARAMEGLTTEHTSQTLQDMAALTPEGLNEAYRRFVDGTWTIVVVGDADSVAEPVRALGLGLVVIVSS